MTAWFFTICDYKAVYEVIDTAVSIAKLIKNKNAFQ